MYYDQIGGKIPLKHPEKCSILNLTGKTPLKSSNSQTHTKKKPAVFVRFSCLREENDNYYC